VDLDAAAVDEEPVAVVASKHQPVAGAELDMLDTAWSSPDGRKGHVAWLSSDARDGRGNVMQKVCRLP
jgi:hypothetical protein